ncbi:MAG: bifunctional oligoribonuclease/PAP phosphatase NrnA [Anaerolineae bacterium]|nr:bifunctional oligoribonuclease/PAP phosphatase NrnA [Anaerolineae bacterium]
MNWNSVTTSMTEKNTRPEQAGLTRTLLEQAHQLIKPAQCPLLICHISPDGDAIGSMVGLGRVLRQMGLAPTLVCSDPIPHTLSFIPGSDEIVNEADAPFDLVIALDSSDVERLGHFPKLPGFADVPLLNIDHHLTNLRFGDVDLVDSQASSTAEIVLQLLEVLAAPLDADTATALLAGIVADTRGFRTNNVTPQVMEAALRLMKAGASLPYVSLHALDSRPTAAVHLWGMALAQLQIEDRVIWTNITLAARHETGYTGSGDAGLVSFLISAEDADAAAVFVECDDRRVEIGLRAKPGFDVAWVALQLGGGGHALAAGCTLPGPLEEAQIRLLTALKASLAEQRVKRKT